VEPICGAVQHYAWGDHTFIPDLLGEPPDGRPWAELWLGTHPHGPATLTDGRPLSAVTGTLQYLLKVLAVAEPLSLQLHPSRAQAQAGFAAGRYPDPEPKPELLCALTTFEAFCGIRPIDATLDLLDELGVDDLAGTLRDAGAHATLAALYHGELPCDPIIAAAASSDRPEAVWVSRLASRYPGDPSVAVTLLLNFVRLSPGDALQLGPGNLHAYLGGAGIELMNASDNVVRGGLTTKPVDVAALLAIVDSDPLDDPVMPLATVYPLSGTSIRLLRLVGPQERTAEGNELVVTTNGGTWFLASGDQLFVEPDVVAYIATA
jgi:mannose-6-phosphate isomerase